MGRLTKRIIIQVLSNRLAKRIFRAMNNSAILEFLISFLLTSILFFALVTPFLIVALLLRVVLIWFVPDLFNPDGTLSTSVLFLFFIIYCLVLYILRLHNKLWDY